MIIWNGRGYWVFILIFACSLLGNLLFNAIVGSTYWDTHKWPFGAALLVAGLLLLFLGQFVFKQEERRLLDPKTGQEVVLRPYHALFFIPVRFWGPILAALGAGIAIVDLIRKG